MSLVLNGSGTITGLSAGGLPDATITQAEIGTNVAGTGPAFSYTQSVSQNIATSTWTKLTFTSQEFDTTSGMYASSKFQPTIAGYYLISGSTVLQATGTYYSQVNIYKNGIAYKQFTVPAGATNWASPSGSALIYLNGSTDYAELYVFHNQGSTQATQNNIAATYFQASMVRAA